MLVAVEKVTVVLNVLSLTCGAFGLQNVDNSSDWSGDEKELQKVVNGSTLSKRNGRQMYKQLVDMLFTDNNSIIPPNADDLDTPVNITMLMVIQNLAYLDMKTQTLSIIAWFQLDWRDPSLSWDINTYPVDMIVVSEKDVWRPVLAIANTFLPRDQIMKIELPISVFSDGTVRWFPGDALLMDCQVDLRFYPFDVQTCIVQVSQWTHQPQHFVCSEIEIRTAVAGNGEWDIVGLDYEYEIVPEPDYDYWLVNYKITLRRKWMFYVINLIFPIILVSALNHVVFILPVSSGDKMSVSVTAFLTLMVFLTLIQDALAKNSDTVCYLTLCLSVQMMLGALAVVQSAVIVAFHHKSLLVEDDNYVQCASLNEKRAGVSQTFGSDGQWDPLDRDQTDHHITKEYNCGRQNGNLDYSSLEYQPRQTPVRSTSDDSRIFFKRTRDSGGERGSNSSGVDWNKVASRIDSICFPVFIILNALSLLVFCIIIGTA